MKKSTIKIEGMSCGHCVMSLRKELEKLPLDIIDVEVGTAIIEFDETKVNSDDIKKAVNEAGYEVISEN